MLAAEATFQEMGRSTGQGEVSVLCGWEGNRRFGVALAIVSQTLWYINYRLNGLEET